MSLRNSKWDHSFQSKTNEEKADALHAQEPCLDRCLSCLNEFERELIHQVQVSLGLHANEGLEFQLSNEPQQQILNTIKSAMANCQKRVS